MLNLTGYLAARFEPDDLERRLAKGAALAPQAAIALALAKHSSQES